MKKIFSLFITLLMLSELLPVIHADSGTAEIFVAPYGTDNSAGSIEEPLATLDGARKMAAKLSESGEKNINIYFRGGEYRMTQGVEFTKSDSGKEGGMITYSAYNDETVDFVGSVTLNPRRFEGVSNALALESIPKDAQKYVGVYNLKSLGIDKLDKFKPAYGYGDVMTKGDQPCVLIMDDIWQDLASYPNGSASYMYNTVIQANSEAVGGSFIDMSRISDERIKQWAKAKNIVVRGGTTAQWAYEMMDVDSVDINKKQLNLPGRFSLMAAGSTTRMGNIKVENLLEELDAPGEYYIDEDELLLYWYPPHSVTNSKLELAAANIDFLNITDVQNISFKNLNFKNIRRCAANVTNCKNVTFYGCKFSNIGMRGVKFLNCYDSGLDSCDLSHIGAGAVSINGGDTDTLTHSNNFVRNCHLNDLAKRQKANNPGIWFNGVGNIITHNVIHDHPHIGIQGLGSENTITYNEIYDVNKENTDTGAIYLGQPLSQVGNEVAYNYIHDTWANAEALAAVSGQHSAYGIYLDDLHSNSDVHHNVMLNVQKSMMYGGGSFNKLHHNITINGEVPIVYDARGRGWKKPDAISMIVWGIDPLRKNSAYDKYRYNIDEFYKYNNAPEGLPAMHNEIKDNLFVDSKNQSSIHDDVKELGVCENNIYASTSESDEVQFVDLENKNYQIKSDSPILQKIPGLADINMDDIGLYTNEYRKSTNRSVGDFKTYLPLNGTVELATTDTFMSWEPAENADRYKVIVATDKEFKNIVTEVETYYTYCRVSNLIPYKTQHYWKVLAYANGYKNLVVKESDVKTFKTIEFDIINTEKYDKAIADAERALQNLKEGIEPGCVPKGTGAKIEASIEKAKAANVKGVRQKTIDEMTENLNNLISGIGLTANKYYTNLDYTNENMSGWVSTPETASFNASEDCLKFIGSSDTSPFSYVDKPIEKNKILCFKTNMDAGASGSTWFAIGLQNKAVAGDFIWGKGGVGYLVVFKAGKIELQKYDKNGAVVQTVDSMQYKHGEENYIEFGAISFGAGNRLVLNVNGVNIYDSIDYNEPIEDDLYFSVIARKQEAYIKNVHDIPADEIISAGEDSEAYVGVKDLFKAASDEYEVKDSAFSDIKTGRTASLSLFRKSDNESTDIYFRADSNSTLPDSKSGTGYKLSVDDKHLILYKYRKGTYQIAAACDNNYILKEQWYNLKIEQNSKTDELQINIGVDGNNVMSFTDSYAIRVGGYFAITARGGGVLIK